MYITLPFTHSLLLEFSLFSFCPLSSISFSGPTPIGTDQTMLDNFYCKEVIDWYDKSAALGLVLPPPTSFFGRLLQSPVALNVGKLTADNAATIAKSHIDRWIGWVVDKEGKGKQIDARARGGMNGRDDKLRQFAFRASVADYSNILGNAAAGKDVGAAATGPIAEAYVGGGS